MTARHAVLVALVLSLGCGAQPAVDLEVEKAAIRETEAEWLAALIERGAEAYVEFVTADIRYLPGDAPRVDGRQGLQEAIAALVEQPGFAVTWQSNHIEVASSGDMAYSIGTYEITTDDAEGEPQTERGKWVDVWRKQEDGSWKASVISSSLDQVPATASAPSE